MTTPHPHAAVLRALADGVPVAEFQIRHCPINDWSALSGYSDWYELRLADRWEIRRKPRTIKVNGFDVPEPCKTLPEYGEKFWYANPLSKFFSDEWHVDSASAPRFLERGLVHLTREAAIAHAKAMLGINPNGEQS